MSGKCDHIWISSINGVNICPRCNSVAFSKQRKYQAPKLYEETHDKMIEQFRDKIKRKDFKVRTNHGK